MRVEVHHIVPSKAGGDDDPENAIALCFDCHADAGHYNAQHPKGTKFSPEELRLARDRWHAIVQERGLTGPEAPSGLYSRYLVCQEISLLHEIGRRELADFPTSNPLLVESPTMDYLKALLARCGDYRHDSLWGEGFDSEDEYETRYPKARRIGRDDPELSYFQFRRELDEQELVERVASQDAITAALRESGAPRHELSTALAYPEECGGVPVQEVYRLRPLWAAFLEITNDTDAPVVLTEMHGRIDDGEPLPYRVFPLPPETPNGKLALPGAPLRPGMSVIVPVAILLAPLAGAREQTYSVESRQIAEARVQNTSHVGYDLAEASRFHAWGPAIQPSRVLYECAGVEHEQAVHDLDLSNLFVVDRYWQMGSCPHAFLETDHTILYVGELLTDGCLRSSEDSYDVPTRVAGAALHIAELEEETTTLDSVAVDGDRVLEDVALRKGDSVRIGVAGGERVTMRGMYTPDSQPHPMGSNPWRRNTLVTTYLRRATGGS